MTAQPTVRDLAVPVRSVNWVRLFAGEDAGGAPCLYATMGQDARPLFVMHIELATGACTRHVSDVGAAHFPVSAIWSPRWKCLFVGSAYAGHLLRYDPRQGRLEDLGAIRPDDPAAANFPCRIDEHPDGTLFIGSYGKCDLTRYSPATGEFTRFGRMDETDMYLYPLCGADGTVASLVKMTRPHVVALDPATGRHAAVGPAADTDTRTGSVDLVKGTDGLLYIRSHEGDFRLRGMELERVERAPDALPAPALPDGTTFAFADAQAFSFHALELTARDGAKRTLNLQWESDGTNLFLVHRGPDDRLYGSSILPEHLFACDPVTGTCVDHGACSISGGEAYSMANLDGRLYVASYPGSRLSVYDPARPYRFGTEPGANPRDLGRVDDVAYRPYAMVAGPAGKVWIASVPDYGMWGGTLAWHDPRTGAFGSHRHLIRDCSPVSLAWLESERLLAVGLAIEGGSGTTPRAERAGLVLWDPARDAAARTLDFGLAIRGVMDLWDAGGGLLYAVILETGADKRPALMLLDVRANAVRSRRTLEDEHGWALGRPCFFGHRGFIYGTARRCVFRAPLGTTDVEIYWRMLPEDSPDAPGALLGDTWYFGTGHRLRALALPAGP